MRTLNFIFCFIFSLTLFISTTAFADDLEPAPKQRKTNRDHRLNKEWYIRHQLVGVGPVPDISSQAFSLGYMVDPDTILAIEYFGGDQPFFPGWFSRRRSRSYRGVGGNIQHFANTTFFLKGGLNYYQINVEEQSNYYGSDYDYGFKGTAGSASFAIGNQWQIFRDGVLSCEWVGINLPIASFVDSEYTSTTSTSTTLKKDLEASQQRYLKDVGLIFAKLAFGYSW
ncbi:MAG: hypothetical protein H7061_13960 [Bdellovibrionaceae bacterium]|nr:hypothetical protein [Bdellovibrio sp.]